MLVGASGGAIFEDGLLSLAGDAEVLLACTAQEHGGDLAEWAMPDAATTAVNLVNAAAHELIAGADRLQVEVER